MNQTDKRSIRFRLCEHKKNLLNIYEKIVVLLNGDLERLISEGKEKELSNGLIASVQALMNNVDFIYWIVNGKHYFVTEDKMTEDDWRYTKLNPCPKCKQQPEFDLDELECRCDDCGYYVSSDTPDKLVKAWNQFAEEPFELELDKAVREHVEGERNDNV